MPSPLPNSSLNRRAAFSIIELLISCAIMLIIYAMMFGFGARQNQMRQKTKCRGSMQKIYVAMQIYANDSRGIFPVVTNALTSEEVLDVLIPRYTADNSIFICPGSKDSKLTPGDRLLRERISYAYYMGLREANSTHALLSDRQVNSGAKTNGQQIFSTDGKRPANNHYKYGGSILFCDGSMKSSGAILEFPLPVATNVVLLNPKP
jgi:type II secretory pathway pseudopilin PulG